MLIDFEVGNFRSIKAPVRLSMQSANAFKEFRDENTFSATERYQLLKSAAIYGANASGKSNLLSAMEFMRWFVFSSSKETQIEEEIGVTPFKLDTSTENEPSHFEICFFQGNRRYRYGFEVDRIAVRKEWLFQAEKQKEEPLFLRDGENIDVSDCFPEGRDVEAKTRNNALFLSVVAQFNGEIAGSVLKWFKGLRILQGLREYMRFSVQMLQDQSMRPLLMKFIQRADMGIEDLVVNEESLDQKTLEGMPDEIRRMLASKKAVNLSISAIHRKFHQGSAVDSAALDFADESEGTKKFFGIAGPILDCLSNGHVLVVDELDSRLHPLLTKNLVRMFNSLESNPKNAQLIFATHDTNLLQHGNLRRDQIWFTEKTEQSATALYSLAEFKLPDGKKVRNDEALEKNYIHGRYGAIPFFGDFETLLKENASGSSHQAE